LLLLSRTHPQSFVLSIRMKFAVACLALACACSQAVVLLRNQPIYQGRQNNDADFAKSFDDSRQDRKAGYRNAWDDCGGVGVASMLGSSAKERLNLVPFPAEVATPPGAKPFLLKKGSELSLGEGIPKDDLSVSLVKKLMADVGEEGKGSQINLRLSKNKDEKAEGYKLKVAHDGVDLEAPSLAGLHQGVQTLRQLAVPGEKANANLPAVSIKDAPRFSWRGLHLDVSRHFFNASSVKRLLDVMSQYKLNSFHWHLTDDQGWRLPVDGYPKLLTVGGQNQAYTKEEVKDVVAYAKARHIKVVPEVDVPGHVEAALAAYPELGNMDIPNREAPTKPRVAWGVSQYTLAPTNATWSFLEKVYDTLGELFPDQVVHIGGDEVMTSEWGESKAAQGLFQQSEESSLKGSALFYERQHTEKQVGKLFETKIADMLKKRGRKAAAWNEAMETAGFPKDGIITAWSDASVVRRAINQSRQVIVADQGKWYFDHSQARSGEPTSFGGCSSLANVYEYNPMPQGLTAEQQKLVIGGQGQLWSEYIPTWKHAEYMAHPRSLALAERLWTPTQAIQSFAEFKTRVSNRLWDLEHAGVNYRRVTKGEGRDC